MTSIRRSALVEHSAERMFDLVNDIEAYPDFMPGCVEARVISRSKAAGAEGAPADSDTKVGAADVADATESEEVLGELCLSKAGITQRFVTRNRLQRPHSITMQMERGNFSRFDAQWRFLPAGEAACKVSLDMEFEFAPGLWNIAARSLFAATADKLVDAFVQRARQLYPSVADPAGVADNPSDADGGNNPDDAAKRV